MRSRRSIGLVALGVALSLASPAGAQWLDHPTPGTPRLPDGSADLSAPAPRTPDGHPDLTGVWRGAGPIYRFNIAQDLDPDTDIQPWAEALFLQRVRDSRIDSPLAHCKPVSVPYHNLFHLTQIVQTPALLVMLYEAPNSPHRAVYTDGRDLPEDPNPAWLGYSVGRWEGDTLVVTTAGFNDLGWLDSAGHPQTESLRITERMRRRDFGHMDYAITIDDPTVFTRPFTIAGERLLAPDTDLLEDYCENERSLAHMSGDTGVRLTPALAAEYAGTYELEPGREIVIAARGDLLFVQGLNEPRLPLYVQSETQFMSTATPVGFEFVRDERGQVTQVIVRGGDAGEERATRKRTSLSPRR